MESKLYKAYAEVDEILELMEDTYKFKIPEKLRELFKKEKLQNYSPNIDLKISLDEQNLQRETFSILAMLNLKYWCEDEKEKQELMTIYKKNDAKKEELIEKIRRR